jgi:hypothetical protein
VHYLDAKYGDMKQLNLQSELHFDFQIMKLPTLPLLVQSVALPGIFTEAPQTSTQFSPIKHPGDTVFFQDLIVTLKVDEGMEAWFEMYKWITGLTRSESYAQFIELLADKTRSLDGSKKLFKNKELTPGSRGYKNLKSTASLTISDSNHIKYIEVVFVNIHPVNMSGLQFRTDESQTGYMTYDVAFSYDYYFPRPVS